MQAYQNLKHEFNGTDERGFRIHIKDNCARCAAIAAALAPMAVRA